MRHDISQPRKNSQIFHKNKIKEIIELPKTYHYLFKRHFRRKFFVQCSCQDDIKRKIKSLQKSNLYSQSQKLLKSASKSNYSKSSLPLFFFFHIHKALIYI